MGRPRKDARELVDAMLWIFKTGAPWRDLPEYYGPWKTVYKNSLRWRDAGVWESILKNLNPDLEPVFTRRKERGKIEIWKKKDGSRTLAT